MTIFIIHFQKKDFLYVCSKYCSEVDRQTALSLPSKQAINEDHIY